MNEVANLKPDEHPAALNAVRGLVATALFIIGLSLLGWAMQHAIDSKDYYVGEGVGDFFTDLILVLLYLAGLVIGFPGKLLVDLLMPFTENPAYGSIGLLCWLLAIVLLAPELFRLLRHFAVRGSYAAGSGGLKAVDATAFTIGKIKAVLSLASPRYWRAYRHNRKIDDEIATAEQEIELQDLLDREAKLRARMKARAESKK